MLAVDMLQAVLAAMAFVLMVCVWGMVMIVRSWRVRSRAGELQVRLGLRQREAQGRVLRLWHDGQEATILGRQIAQRATISRRLAKELRNAGVTSPLRKVLTAVGGALVLLFAAASVLLHSVLAGLGAVALALVVLSGLLHRRANKRIGLFERQLIDALGLAARSLRAGQPLLGAFEVVAHEIAAPAGTLFTEICQSQSMGLSVEESMRKVAAESDHPDMQMFATAVVIQLRSGGNLADVVERLAVVIQHRLRLKWRVRVLTAQTQFSKRVLLALPIVFFALLSIVNPRYLEPMLNMPMGQWILGGAGAGLVLGSWWMNRLAELRY